jgi:hypothetical protein
MSETYRAPDAATIDEWAIEAGRTRAEGYRLVRLHRLPHIRVGVQGIRVLMPAFRAMCRGEAIDERLLVGEPVTTRSLSGDSTAKRAPRATR